MFALLSLVQSPGMPSRWIHPAFSVRSMECFYHTMDIRLNVRITQPCSISRHALSLDSSCFFCPEHGMFLSYHGYKTQCSHYSALFNLQAYPLSGFFVPDSLSVPIIPCSFSCSKYFASEKADIKAGTVSSHSYICRHRDVSVSLMFLGFKKALCFLYHYAA